MLASLALPPTVPENEPVNLTGRIIDYDLGQSHQLLINWGDGSSSTTTNLPPCTGYFNISHVYLKAASNVAINLTVQDGAGGSVATNLSLTVLPQAASPTFLSLTPTNQGHILLQLQGSPGATYRIQVSANLMSWADLAPSTADSNGFFSVEDAASPMPMQRFYRAIWP